MVQVADRLVVDLSPDGTVSVATHLEGDELADSGPPFQLAWPLDDEALAGLRWYVEDYRSATPTSGCVVDRPGRGWSSRPAGAMFTGAVIRA